MHFSTLFSSFALFAATGLAKYVLEDDYFQGNFFDQFTFWDSPDPTHGFVAYQDQASAQSSGLISNISGMAKMTVDSSTVTPSGRPSVRITSNKAYNSGLVIANIAHMPGGACGTWPAFWMLGPNWPNGGEIDILEGVHNQLANDVTLHTGPGCSVSNTGGFSGSMTSSTCESSNACDTCNNGCQIASADSKTYGAGFNAKGGGVYAMEWTSSYIDVYFFPNNSVPDNVLSKLPDPSQWGTPMAHFAGDCDMSTAFVDQQIVFDTTFCGDWAGNTWDSSGCATNTNEASCQAYVENNPEVFSDTYWSIRSLKVFQNDGSAAPAQSTHTATSTSIQYVTQPVSSTYVAPTVAPTTFAVATSSDGGYAPVIGPSGSVGVGSSPSESGTAYAPVVGGDGTVGNGAWAAPAPAPAETAPSGSWSTAPDGAVSYAGWRREEEVVEVREARHARHLRFHKRHHGRF